MCFVNDDGSRVRQNAGLWPYSRTLASAATAFYWRTIRISSMLGSNSPPAVRSIVFQVKELSSNCFIALTIEAARPSGKVPLLRMNQLLPRCSQVASANVPLESNVQERIVLAAGS